jgi:uncharacterized membrane protein
MRRVRRTGQRGATLVIALIMLVALAMLSALGLQWQSDEHARLSATARRARRSSPLREAAIELTLSTPAFSVDPVAVAASAIPIDVDGDANPDYQVSLTPAPTCYRVRVLKVNELDPTNAGDRACLGSSASPNPGIETAGSTPPTGDSLCADSEWNLRGVVTDPRTNASAAVNKGVAIRTLSTDATNACP